MCLWKEVATVATATVATGTGVVESRFDFPLVSRNHIKDLLQPIPTKFLVATLKIAYQHNIAYQYQSNSITNAAI